MGGSTPTDTDNMADAAQVFEYAADVLTALWNIQDPLLRVYHKLGLLDDQAVPGLLARADQLGVPGQSGSRPDRVAEVTSRPTC